jgi:hypothetical protein
MVIVDIFDRFTNDIIRSIPEYAEKGQIIRDLFKSKHSEKYGSIFLDHFLSCVGNRTESVLNQDEEFFTKETGSGKTDLVKGLDIAPYWQEFSNDTKKAVWKYMYGIIIISEKNKSNQTLKDKDDFGNFIENHLNPQVIEEMMKKLKEENEENADQNDFFKGILDGKIGELAKEIGNDLDLKELAESMGINENDKGNPMEFMEKLTSGEGSGKMMELMQKVGGKVASKIKSGELNPKDMLGDVLKMATKLGGSKDPNNMMANLASMAGNMGNPTNMGNPDDMMKNMMGNMKNHPMMSAVAGMVNQQMKKSNMVERLRQKHESNQQIKNEVNNETPSNDEKKKTRRGNRGGKKKKN